MILVLVLVVILAFAGWVVASVVAGLVIGRVLACCSRTRDAVDAEAEDHLAGFREGEAA